MGAKILIVDDSRMVRDMLREALKLDQHEVLEAADGRQALEAVKGTTPDLIISDINMPEMDGFTLIRALRDLPAHRFTPILVLTTEAGEAMKQRGREAGATGWIVKPFQTGPLRQTVITALELREKAMKRRGASQP